MSDTSQGLLARATSLFNKCDTAIQTLIDYPAPWNKKFTDPGGYDERVAAKETLVDAEIQKLLSTAHSQFSSGVFVLDESAYLLGARRLGASGCTDAQLLDDSFRDYSKLAASEWSNEEGAYVLSGEQLDAYVGATSDSESTSPIAVPVGGGDAAACFWDIPINTSKILPEVCSSGMFNGYNKGSRVAALILQCDVGWTPHAVRRTFIDVLYHRIGSGLGFNSGSYPNKNWQVPQFCAKNIAIDGKRYGDGNYSTTVVIPIYASSSTSQIRIVNNGDAPLNINSYAFAWINKKQVA